ncbi:MAG: ABC transporter permease, partial [Acidobacteriaceae bacterium]|nr:ABC transporter permease [Acidobacteriaceae bacterium]
MFVLRMAVRETRASWRRLLFFFICIAIGVAAIVALRSVIQNVRAVFGREAKSLNAADVLVSTTREWTPETLQTIDRRTEDAHVTARSETIETPTMVRPAEAGKAVVRMVELRAVQDNFPLYGTLELDGATYTHELLKGRGALVRPELLAALDVHVGDEIVIGQATFTIRGVITNEPGRSLGTFSMGPRVLVDYDDMAATGLTAFGSRVRRVLLLKVPDAQIEPLVRALHRDFRDDFVSARSFRSTDDAVGQNFDRAENYLSLVGLVIVVLGGIAVSSVTRVFVLQKMRSIAVLKCLGARSRQIIAVYLLQILTLGLAGSLLGVVLASLAVNAIPYVMTAPAGAASLLKDVQYGVSLSAALQGIGIGVLVSLLFSLVPLLQVRGVKPSMLLRDETVAASTDWLRIWVMVLVSSGLVALTAWQAASLRVGLIVCIGFTLLAGVLQLAGRVLVRLISPLASTRSFPLRHAVLHLSRPGNQTRVILLAVGLGAFFIVGVRSLQNSLLAEFSVESAANSPDMFLMDVQRGQAEGMRQFLSARGVPAASYQLLPVLRARVTGVRGRETSLESFEDVRARGSLSREYTVTYRDRLEDNERVVAGAFWSGPSTEPEVSVE